MTYEEAVKIINNINNNYSIRNGYNQGDGLISEKETENRIKAQVDKWFQERELNEFIASLMEPQPEPVIISSLREGKDWSYSVYEVYSPDGWWAADIGLDAMVDSENLTANDNCHWYAAKEPLEEIEHAMEIAVKKRLNIVYEDNKIAVAIGSTREYMSDCFLYVHSYSPWVEHTDLKSAICLALIKSHFV